jgi:integral membrane sensor domain MASE1
MPSLTVALVVPLTYSRRRCLAITLTGQAGNVAALWFASAVLLAALLRHEPPAWPGLLLLTAGADFAANALLSEGPAVALGIAATDNLEVLLVAATLYRLAGDGPRLASSRWLGLFGLACLLVPTLSSTAGAGLLALAHGAPFLATWTTWYLAAALGLLIVTPVLLSWTDPELRDDSPGRAALPALLLAGLVLAVTLLVFARNAPPCCS